MGWFRRRRPAGPVARRFAALQALPQPARDAALAGPMAAGWIEAAALYGLVEAQTLHAQLLLDRGEPALALRWFRAAAGAGDARAHNMVGRCLEHGWGTGTDLVGAARHYRVAAEAGLDWGRFNLGMALLYGLGVPRDRLAAFGWLERAAAQGNCKAANMLGRFHEEGWDRPRDMALATRCYRAGAAGGDFRAQFNLATVLFSAGRRDEAVALFHQAWQAGPADFRAEAGPALRSSGDPALLALAASAGGAHPAFASVGAPRG